MFYAGNWIHSFPEQYQWSNATLVTKGMAPYGAVALGEIDWEAPPCPHQRAGSVVGGMDRSGRTRRARR